MPGGPVRLQCAVAAGGAEVQLARREILPGRGAEHRDAVYELVDGEDPAPRLAADFAALGKAGWELS